MNPHSIHRPLTPDTCDRIRLLRDNVLDLSIAMDDIDAELAPLLAQRDELAMLLREAETELASLVSLAA